MTLFVMFDAGVCYEHCTWYPTAPTCWF